MKNTHLNVGIFYRDFCSGGGAPRDRELFSQNLSNEVKNVYVFYYNSEKSKIGTRKNGNITYFGYEPPRIPLSINKKIEKDLKKLKIDNMYIYGGNIPENYKFSNLCKKLNINYVLTIAEAYNEFLQNRWKLLKRIYKYAIEKKIIIGAYKIRVYSSHNLQELLRYHDSNSNYFMLEEGVDVELVGRQEKPAGSIGFRKDEDSINLLYFGRIDLFEKGIDTAIRVVSKGGFGKKVILNIIGAVETRHADDSIEYTKFLKLVENSQNVIYHGKKKGNELYSYVKSADLVISLTRHDGIPRAIRESLYLSVPLIVTIETNVGDRLKEFDAGYVVSREELSVREAIDNYIALSKTQKSSMRKNAYRLSSEVYDWKKIAKRYVEITSAQ